MFFPPSSPSSSESVSVGSSAARYRMRQKRWKQRGVRFWWSHHHFWWLLHNCVHHPLLGILPSEETVFLHDWSSQKLNGFAELRPSTPPEIPSRWRWLAHNVWIHMLIGLFPVDRVFAWHDASAQNLGVPDWV